MDKLIVSGLELWINVGCSPEERAFPQRLEMDVALELSLAEAGRTDDIAKTVDYADAVRRLKETLEPKTYNLAETIAEEAAALLLKSYPIQAVTVHLKKRAFPGINCAVVEIRRAQSPT
jgi:dihydroneopterin aldolase